MPQSRTQKILTASSPLQSYNSHLCVWLTFEESKKSPSDRQWDDFLLCRCDKWHGLRTPKVVGGVCTFYQSLQQTNVKAFRPTEGRTAKCLSGLTNPPLWILSAAESINPTFPAGNNTNTKGAADSQFFVFSVSLNWKYIFFTVTLVRPVADKFSHNKQCERFAHAFFLSILRGWRKHLK